MNREITLLAVPGKSGFLGASGLATAVSAARPVRWRRSRAASQPMPMPEFCRKWRREASIDIDKLAHVEDQEAQPIEGVAPKVIKRGLALGGSGGSAERQLPGGVHRCLLTVAGQLFDAG